MQYKIINFISNAFVLLVFFACCYFYNFFSGIIVGAILITLAFRLVGKKLYGKHLEEPKNEEL